MAINLIQLLITLQTGFNNDLVIIKVNGEEVFNKKGITSSQLPTGEQSFALDLPEGLTVVNVSVPTRNLADTKSYEIANNKFLGISIVKPEISPSGIRFILRDKTFYSF